MSSTQNEFESQWRASAFEAVPYTDDFPEALLVLPELYDGAIDQGNATLVETTVYLPAVNAKAATKAKLRVKDNGDGIATGKESRLLSWAAKKSTSIHHRYGHGSKKMLTKWMRDYNTAVWSLKTRTKTKRAPNSLNIFKAPFLGMETNKIVDEENETDVFPSGTEWEIEFDPSILAPFTDGTELLKAIKELICTRYSRNHLQKTVFSITVYKGENIIAKSVSNVSPVWKTFREALDDEVANHRAVVCRRKEKVIDGGRWVATEYKMVVHGNDSYPLKDDFFRYGHKNMKCSRAHVSIGGRYIEAIPLYKLAGRGANHNDFNGYFVVVDFINNTPEDFEKMPLPCTTKVSFYENCPVFNRFKIDMRAFLDEDELPIPATSYTQPVPDIPLTVERINKMGLADLKEECKKRNIILRGNKTELASRLIAAIQPASVVIPKTVPNSPVIPTDYNEFFAYIHPKVKAENPTFTPQQITTEIARLWNIRKASLRPVPVPATPSTIAPKPQNSIPLNNAFGARPKVITPSAPAPAAPTAAAPTPVAPTPAAPSPAPAPAAPSPAPAPAAPDSAAPAPATPAPATPAPATPAPAPSPSPTPAPMPAPAPAPSPSPTPAPTPAPMPAPAPAPSPSPTPAPTPAPVQPKTTIAPSIRLYYGDEHKKTLQYALPDGKTLDDLIAHIEKFYE